MPSRNSSPASPVVHAVSLCLEAVDSERVASPLRLRWGGMLVTLLLRATIPGVTLRSSVRTGVGVLLTGLCLLWLLPMGVPARADGEYFADGFETGSMSSWTAVRSVDTQQNNVQSSDWAARAHSTGTPSYARKTLPSSYADIRYSLSAYVASQGFNPVTLLAIHDAQGASVLSLYLTPTAKLALRNVTNTSSTLSSVTVTQDSWHRLALAVQADGANSEVEVTFDGSVVASLSGPTSLGTTTSLGRIQLGDAASSLAPRGAPWPTSAIPGSALASTAT